MWRGVEGLLTFERGCILREPRGVRDPRYVRRRIRRRRRRRSGTAIRDENGKSVPQFWPPAIPNFELKIRYLFF